MSATEARAVVLPRAAFPFAIPIAQIATTDPILAAACRAVEAGRPVRRRDGHYSEAKLTGPQIVLLRAYLRRLSEPQTISERRARASAIDTLTGAMP